MYHCHIPEHEDAGMMGAFIVAPAAVSAVSPHMAADTATPDLTGAGSTGTSSPRPAQVAVSVVGFLRVAAATVSAIELTAARTRV